LLPIVLFQIFYNLAWLGVAAYPLWMNNEPAGSPAEGMTRVFLWVVLPMVAMSWRYFLRMYLAGKQTA
jgi:hypothetical protein